MPFGPRLRIRTALLQSIRRDELSIRERGFCMDILWEFSVDFLGPSVPLNEGQKSHREIHSKIHDKIPAKSTNVVKNGVTKSTLQEEGGARVRIRAIPPIRLGLSRRDSGNTPETL